MDCIWVGIPGNTGSLEVKNLPANIRDVSSIHRWGRYLRAGNGIPLQYFCLRNPKDRGALWAIVSGVIKESDMSCLYIFEISCLSVASFAIIFFHSEGYLFTLLVVSFVVQKLLILIKSYLFIFAFISNILGGGS